MGRNGPFIEHIFTDVKDYFWRSVFFPHRLLPIVMYGRPPFGKGFFDIAALGSGAVMYPAFVRGTS
jgi:hypothetical protein